MLIARDIINTLLKHRQGPTYLEIGVKAGSTFCHVEAPRKIAVDPIPVTPPVSRHLLEARRATYYAKTSDLFFQENDRIFADAGIDVAFVDGLHTCQQVLSDVANCLHYLAPHGVIIAHDCNPKSESAAAPGTSPEARKTVPGHEGQHAWNGDVWKAIVHLRSCSPDLNVFVLDCDQGLGFITRGQPDNMLSCTPAQIDAMTYRDLAADRERLLNLKPPSHFQTFLAHRLTAHPL
jgi:hypothetical protein